MALGSGQRRHLISAYATVSHLLRQMEDAAREGRSPTGLGSPLTPLPDDEIERICGPVRELQARLRASARELAPEELAAFEKRQSAHNTRVWMSNLLEKVRIAADGLTPRRMRSYGSSWTEEDRQAMADLHSELSALIGESRRALDEGQ
jgi:hypothetical protein